MSFALGTCVTFAGVENTDSRDRSLCHAPLLGSLQSKSRRTTAVVTPNVATCAKALT